MSLIFAQMFRISKITSLERGKRYKLQEIQLISGINRISLAWPGAGRPGLTLHVYTQLSYLQKVEVLFFKEY